MNFIRLLVPATFDNYDEQAYISANPDIMKAIQSGAFERSAYKHFCKYGNKENRKQWLKCNLDELRAEKVKILEPYLRNDMTLEKEGLIQLPIRTSYKYFKNIGNRKCICTRI